MTSEAFEGHVRTIMNETDGTYESKCRQVWALMKGEEPVVKPASEPKPPPPVQTTYGQATPPPAPDPLPDPDPVPNAAVEGDSDGGAEDAK